MVQHATAVEIRFFHSGYCTAHSAVVDPEKGKGKSRFYAVWALIKHPLHGYLLFDTGYAPRFYEATKSFPGKLYAWATPVFVSNEESAVARLKAIGISPSEVKSILISHFHADHIGGLLDFPEAELICSRKAMKEVENKKGFSAVRKGILEKLLPPDLESRIRFVEDISEARIDKSAGLVFYDLYQDGSIQLTELPGHARGMLGLLAQGTKEKIFLASDASWSRDTFFRQVKPSRITKLFFDSWEEFGNTYKKLFRYYQTHPEETMLFTHCPETMNYIETHAKA